MWFSKDEVLIAAIHLCGQAGVAQVDVNQMTLHHIPFDARRIVLSDGT